MQFVLISEIFFHVNCSESFASLQEDGRLLESFGIYVCMYLISE